jgi:Icc-related predicted phosphoesterase
MKIVCISDTHNRHREVVIPPCDVLVHAGDFTGGGSVAEVAAFGEWLSEQPCQYAVVVPGNHDFLFEENLPLGRALLPSATVLMHGESIDIDGVKFWGSPKTPWFGGWAFNYRDGEERWGALTEADVVITHGPPAWVLDEVADGRLVGCPWLRDAVRRVRPAIHVFGHIHESAGVATQDGTTYINAAMLTRNYRRNGIEPHVVYL